jgi:tRNA-specific 2-thiouridylase
MKKVNGKKVFVGLSGGVDSALSAALLKRAGARVTGVFIKGWYPPSMPCTWAEDRRDAMRVAAHLNIPFVTLDASKAYKESVIDYLLKEYKAGRTPNPDVMCNRDIKFGIFYRFAKEHGAEHIATGHYRSGEKDQSYFLWAVPREILEDTLFPLENMEKTEVRALAKRFGLPVFDKPDSQGVCFLGSVSIKDFLIREFGENTAVVHTLGERVEGGYVVGKDMKKKSIEISSERVPAGKPVTSIVFSQENWLEKSDEGIEVQYRYRGPFVKGKIMHDAFIPAAALAELPVPGQSLVFYKNRTLIGGGIIEK